MKISAKASVDNMLYEKHKNSLKHDLKRNLCEELVKHDLFIEPPITEVGIEGFTNIEMHLFALSYRDIGRLQELSKKYPEIESILHDIVVKPD